ncbi:hypothetical protein VNO77_44030 [Canavalia gladiata]|uniref:Uncharacterized protein n=1 Tax=Canavalia gladiata TaxID=3824 RepID=A0AAN9PNF2_CANGL
MNGKTASENSSKSGESFVPAIMDLRSDDDVEEFEKAISEKRYGKEIMRNEDLEEVTAFKEGHSEGAIYKYSHYEYCMAGDLQKTRPEMNGSQSSQLLVSNAEANQACEVVNMAQEAVGGAGQKVQSRRENHGHWNKGFGKRNGLSPTRGYRAGRACGVGNIWSQVWGGSSENNVAKAQRMGKIRGTRTDGVSRMQTYSAQGQRLGGDYVETVNGEGQVRLTRMKSMLRNRHIKCLMKDLAETQIQSKGEGAGIQQGLRQQHLQ